MDALLRRTATTVLLMVVAALIAVGYGRFVYPVNPLIVWCLLFFCWLCYRLHRRALETFGPRRKRFPEPSDDQDDFPSS